jgi:hypothetical protein
MGCVGGGLAGWVSCGLGGWESLGMSNSVSQAVSVTDFARLAKSPESPLKC